MADCTCGDSAYVTLWEERGIYWCWKCRASAGIANGVIRQNKIKPFTPLLMPPPYSTMPLTEDQWIKFLQQAGHLQKRLWPNLTFEMVEHRGFYIGNILNAPYLVMPITRGGQPICFSARSLAPERPELRKYRVSEGHKAPWLSSDTLEEADVVFFSEGVADAVYLAQVAASVACLGSSYGGQIDALLKDKTCVVAFDNDFMGNMGASILARQLLMVPGVRKVAIWTPKNSTLYPSFHEADPTDIPLLQINEEVSALLAPTNRAKFEEDRNDEPDHTIKL